MANHYQFGDKMKMLFERFQRPGISYLNSLVSMVLKVLQKGKHSTFLKLKQPLLKMILQK